MVDTETYEILSLASLAGIPAAVLRVVSDSIDRDLPNFNKALNAQGDLDGRKALRIALGSPLRTLRLMAANKRALRQLTQALRVVLTAEMENDQSGMWGLSSFRIASVLGCNQLATAGVGLLLFCATTDRFGDAKHTLREPDRLATSGMVGLDADGSSGLRYDVDHHYKRLFGFAALTSAFSAAFDLPQRNTQSVLTYPSVGDTASAAVGRDMSQSGEMITPRNLNVQPTINVPAGYKFNVRVNRDVLFNAPYQPMEANPLPTKPPGQFQRRTDFVTDRPRR